MNLKGILTEERANSLRDIPLQETDVLLHECGAPPIHTPLKVLQELPQKVKDRLYVVHTSALAPDSGLRVAPTGTKGTIRLDDSHFAEYKKDNEKIVEEDIETENICSTFCCFAKKKYQSGNEAHIEQDSNYKSYKNNEVKDHPQNFQIKEECQTYGPSHSYDTTLPLVSKRPTCVSDAWFMLNLLSAVPFFSR